jgi:hypothetical protein
MPFYTSAATQAQIISSLGFTPYNSSNPSGFTSNTGTVTGVTGSNGVTSSGGTAPNLTMSGTYSGTFRVSSGDISATGDVVASYSDSRLKNRKENITNALDKIETLNGFYYTANDRAIELYEGALDKDEVMIGVSAQEVYKVMPEVIKPAPIDSDYLTVDYGRMVPLLIEAIKELNAEIKELKSHK